MHAMVSDLQTDTRPASDPSPIEVDVLAEAASSAMLTPDTWELVLRAESARCARYGRIATIVVIEVAGLDRLAAQWGPDAARDALRTAARHIRRGARTSDFVAWIDRCRFAIILTETDEVAAINHVERVRDRGERELRAVSEHVRLRVGWASPKGSSTLLAARHAAERRLAADTA
jgi:diguanylate cyclase (GGDEF)-like protein